MLVPFSAFRLGQCKSYSTKTALCAFHHWFCITHACYCLAGEAESGLERLHQCAEKELQVYLNAEEQLKDFNEFRSKLAGLTSVTRNFFENLVRALENGLSDVNSRGACSRMGSSKSLGGGSSRGRSGKGKGSTPRSSGSNRNIDDSGH